MQLNKRFHEDFMQKLFFMWVTVDQQICLSQDLFFWWFPWKVFIIGNKWSDFNRDMAVLSLFSESFVYFMTVPKL